MGSIRIYVRQGDRECEIECSDVQYNSEKIDLIEKVFEMLAKYGTD